MRVSEPLPSIIHGITTRAKTVADPKYLKTQLNMRTDDSSGLRKRPPTVAVASKISAAGFNPATDYVKDFILRQTTYFMLVKLATDLDNPESTDVLVFDEFGNEFEVSINTVAYKYLQGQTNNSDVKLNVHGDQVFISNSSKTTAMNTAVRDTVKHTLIHVKTAPKLNEVIIISITGQDGTEYPIGGSSITVGSTEGTNAVEVVASQIAALSIPGLTLSATGATVQIVEDSTDNEVIVQLSNDNDLIAIGEEVEQLSDLPRNAPTGKVVGVRAKGAPDKTTLYLRADLDVASTASEANAQGEISWSSVRNWGGTGNFMNWLPSDVAGTGSLRTFVQRDIQSVYIAPDALYDLGVSVSRLKVSVDDILNIPPGSKLVRATIVDAETGAIAVDVAMDAGQQLMWLGNFDIYVSTTEVLQTAIEAGKRYRVYFNLIGSVSTGKPIDTILWRETSKAGEVYTLDGSTMPMSLSPTIDDTTGNKAFILDVTTWDAKNAGNELNNPVPPFIGSTISTTAIFQNRLVALTADNVYTSETDNTASFFRNTVSQVLSTQPVNIRSTASDSSPFAHAINHNKDLMLTTENAQYKLDGKIPITPQTAGLPQVSAYSNDTNIVPKSLGNKVHYGFSYGQSTGIAEYSSSSLSELQERADSITDNVKGFISTNVELITGDASTGVIVVGDRSGDLYVCDHDTELSREEQKRYAWSKWNGFRSDSDYVIESMSMTKTKLSLVISHDNQLDLVSMQLDQDAISDDTQMYLDNQGLATVDGSYQLTLPTGYLIHDNMVIAIDYGQDYAATLEEYTVISPNVIELVNKDPALIGVDFIFGTTYDTDITPQYRLGRDQKGRVNSSTNIRILRWNIYLNRSASVTAEIETPYATIPDQYWSGLISGDINTITNQTANTTAVFKVSFKQKGDTALLHITSNSHLPMNITEIEWIGNYITRGRRF